MPASAPLIVMPEMVIGLLVPIFLFAKVAVAELWLSVTVSPVSTPDSAAEVFTRSDVATADASYTRSVAVMPMTVRILRTIEAVTVG